MNEIYLDNSATTKTTEAVIKEMEEVLTKHYGNPSSLHGKGVEAERHLKESRERIASLLEVKPGEIYFTSGGTEANNWALVGCAKQNRGRGKHIITTEIEHASILACCKMLEEEGFEVSYIPVDKEGLISEKALKKAIRENTVLVSVMHVNNETGVLQPLERVGKIINEAKKISGKNIPLFHVDAVQSYGKIPFSAAAVGADMVTLSSHKIHGPKGTGALFIRKGVKIKPLIVGGEQEGGLRAGTENLPGIAGFGKAAAEAGAKFKDNLKRLQKLQEVFYEEITKIKGVFFNSPPPPKGAPHIANIYFEGIEKSEVLVHMLENFGVFVSSGSACHSRRPEPSHVLRAMGLPAERVSGSIRVSFSILNTEEEVKEAVTRIREAVEEIRKL